MKSGRLYLALAVMVAMSGCEGVGVGASSDPLVKFDQARELERQGRFFMAQRVLLQAVEISEKRRDEWGIAESYRQLGFFYRAPIPPNSHGLLPDDFAETTDGVENRYLRSNEYFRKSAELYEKIGDNAAVSNLDFVMAQNYLGPLKDQVTGCKLLDRSLELHHRAVDANPSLHVILPPNYQSLDDAINDFERRFCAPVALGPALRRLTAAEPRA